MIAGRSNYTGVAAFRQFLIPKIVAHFRRGERVIELGNTQVWRDFSDVRDVAHAYAAIVDKKPIGQTFNICSGVSHSLADVLDMMSEISGYRIEVRVNPAFVRGNKVARLVGPNARLVACCGAGISIDLATTLRWMYPAQPDPLVLVTL